MIDQVYHGSVSMCLDWLEARNYLRLSVVDVTWLQPYARLLIHAYEEVAVLRQALDQAPKQPFRREAIIVNASGTLTRTMTYTVRWIKATGGLGDLFIAYQALTPARLRAYYQHQGDDAWPWPE